MWNKSRDVNGRWDYSIFNGRWDYSIVSGSDDMPSLKHGGHVIDGNGRGYFAYDVTSQLLGNYSRLEIAKKVVEEAAHG